MRKTLSAIGIAFLCLFVIGGATAIAITTANSRANNDTQLELIETITVPSWEESTFQHENLQRIIVHTYTPDNHGNWINTFGIHADDWGMHLGAQVISTHISLHIGWRSDDQVYHSRNVHGWDNFNFPIAIADISNPHVVIATTYMAVVNDCGTELIRLPFGRTINLGEFEWNLQAHNLVINLYGGVS